MGRAGGLHVGQSMASLGYAALLAALPAGDARAQTFQDKQCIFSAATKLPNIPGLEITGSRAKPAPADAKKIPGLSTMLVEIDVKAAGQNGTYAFLCGFKERTTVTEPMGLSKSE
jgi:hypothetical protein